MQRNLLPSTRHFGFAWGKLEEVLIMVPMQELEAHNLIDRRWTDEPLCEPQKPKSKSRRARKGDQNDDVTSWCVEVQEVLKGRRSSMADYHPSLHAAGDHDSIEVIIVDGRPSMVPQSPLCHVVSSI